MSKLNGLGLQVGRRATKLLEMVLERDGRKGEDQPCVHKHREGQSQAISAIAPKRHLAYLNPTVNLATRGLNKVSLVIKQA